jgi:mRNA interferase MazF
MTRTFSIGDVVLAKFPEQDPQGREQQGLRPAVVVALPEQIGTPRFPLIVVVPLTTD